MSMECDVCGKKPQVGNNVSHANNKSKRRFLPNLQETSLLSDALGHTVRVRLSVRALHTVDRNGGIDAYLLKTSDSKLPPEALSLKRRIKKAAARAEARAG